MSPAPSSSGSQMPPITRAVATLESVQATVGQQLDRVAQEIGRVVASDFDLIDEVAEYLRLMRGKMFRPTLVLLANAIGGKPRDEAVTFAAAVELVHLATLVHDDAVDHSVLRRGQPTVNALWTHQMAIIMGDYLYSRAVTELASVGVLEAVSVLGQAANEMSVGEMRQLTSHDALSFSEQDYYLLIAAKTASLMSAACELGALAGAPDHRDPLSRFGHQLGMAFQIADDLLDYTGIEEVTGKPTGQDLRERKVTLPLVAALTRAPATELAEIRRFFTLADPTDEEILRLVGIVDELGGLAYARQRAAEFAESAEECLSRIEQGAPLRALQESVAWVISRSR